MGYNRDEIKRINILNILICLLAITSCIGLNENTETTTTTLIPTTIEMETTTSLHSVTTTIIPPEINICGGRIAKTCLIFSKRGECSEHYVCPNESCYQCEWYDNWCDIGKKCIENETTNATTPATTTTVENIECYKNSDCGEIYTYFYCNYEISLDEQQPHTIGTAVFKVTKVPICESPGTPRARCILSHREVMWQSCSGWGECTQHNETFANCTPCYVMGKVWNPDLKKCTSLSELS
ncbi:MAG: hypothetical protein DRO94_01330 [Candidatus Altiarchaeales archaeon]|nr:MAG: hypothetical protein DRO94_01330 [Candidatus Altiarchaeales archaeon]